MRILIPSALLKEMEAGQLRLILAHELAHVRRRDYLPRWLEWLVCVGFWWNPVAWWARRNLRINEEICCDALVLTSLQPKPHIYAIAPMTVVEFLASPALRPPAMASEINSGGFLEWRFRMIVSTKRIKKTPRWLLAGILLMALGLMPLGVAYAQDYDAVERRLGEAVSNGELSLKQAGIMMVALQRTRQHDNRKDLTRVEIEILEAELGEMVEAGKISREEARARFDDMRKAMAGEKRGRDRGR